MREIVARRLVEHLERTGFVVMKRPPIEGGAALRTRIRWMSRGVEPSPASLASL
jgi:hypothetical protein